MDSRLEIQPDRFAVVVGPQFATQVVKELFRDGARDGADEKVTLPTFDFKSIVDRGVSYLLEKETFVDDAARAKFEARYSNAYELDPVFVLRKITSSLRAAGCYGEWLAELFECRLLTGGSSSESLERLLDLQSRGALLVYAHCDEIVARAAGQEPVVLNDLGDLERWATGERVGILQPHGVYSKPDSVQLDCQLYDGAAHPLSAAMERLEQALGGRSVILLGDDWGAALSHDPLLANFCRRFVRIPGGEGGDAVVLNTSRDSAEQLLGLPVNASSPFPFIYPITRGSSDLWRQVDLPPVSSSGDSPHQYKVVCLLVSSQSGARDVSHMMFGAPGGVNFALVNPVTYQEAPAYSVLLRVSSAGLGELWHWLLTSSLAALLSSGVVGLSIGGRFFLWLRDPTTLTPGAGRTGEEEGAECSNNSNNSTSEVHRQGPGDSAVSTLVSPPAGNSGSPQDLHSPPPSRNKTHHHASPSPQPWAAGASQSEPRHNHHHHHHHHHGKIVQRYKVVKKRSGQLLTSATHAADGYGALFTSKTCEEPGMLFGGIPHTESGSSKYARRGSLPPIKCGEAGNTLALFAERLQTSSNGAPPSSAHIPSYVAIKRALLSDKFKQVQNPISRLVAPKMLLNLLQAKKQNVELTSGDKLSLVAYRRNSDPGSYLHHRDKTRRRQLFMDENTQWIKTYSSVIDRKIQAWRQKRLLRMQKEYLLQQQQQREKVSILCQPQSELQLMSAAKLMSGQLYASLASSSAASSLTTLPQAFMTAGGAGGVNGFSAAPLMYQLPSAGLSPTPILVPASFVSPYAFMGGYATIPTTAPAAAAAYFMPPAALAATAAVGGTQQGMMLLPSGSTSSAGGSPLLLSALSDVPPDTKPPFSSLLGPTKSPPVSEAEMEKQKQSSGQYLTNFVGSRKRKTSFPEKLSSLLQPPSDPDPSSPPNGKRFCTDTTRHLPGSVSPPPPSSHTHTSSHDYHSSHHSSSSHHHHHHHCRHHHHYSHHSSSSTSSHHTTSSSHHRHYPPSSPLSRHAHKPASPLEQCLLQPPASPGSDGGRVTDSAGESSASSPSSDYASHPSPQLWQFLLDLLLTGNCSHLIQWTDCSEERYEFTIHQPAEVALLWGKCTNNSAMNYDKLARGLRYYYSKGIIDKVEGKKLTFRYNDFARSYVQQRCSRQAVDVTSNVEEMVVVE